LRTVTLLLASVLMVSGCSARPEAPDAQSGENGRADSSAGNLRPAHHKADGTFVNTDGTAISKSFTDLLRWRWTRTEPEALPFPVLKPDPAKLQNPDSPQITWIGHSAFLLQVGGKNILTDPHFTERASPLSFLGPERVVESPLTVEELPHIDAIVISHNHYDHLDEKTIRLLDEKQKHNPPLYFVPLGLKKELNGYDIEEVIEMDWWETHEFSGMQFTALPVKHWSQRNFFDRNKTLWAGWLVDIGEFRFFHTGDSGYSSDFAKIGEDYPGIDLATIPIGAYDPRWFMKDAHMSPEEAAQVFIDLKAEKAIGMHWGTFILTDEEMDEPPVRLRAALKKNNIRVTDFSVMKHGEVLRVIIGQSPEAISDISD